MLRRLATIMLAAAGAFAATTVSDCAPGTSVFRLDGAHLDPADPKAGDAVNLHLAYTVPAGVLVRGGVTEYDVTINYIPMEPYMEPLCQDIPCPLGEGVYTNITQSTWPTGIHGAVMNIMRWKGEDEETLLCLKVTTKFA